MIDVSCGVACGKDLPCGGHKCLRVCHKNACLGDGETCQQPCTKKRALCDHMCAAPCHTDKPCPVSKCKAMVSLCVCMCAFMGIYRALAMFLIAEVFGTTPLHYKCLYHIAGMFSSDNV